MDSVHCRGSPPPAHSSTSTYEPRWLQQQRCQQQQVLHNTTHSPAASCGHQHKERLWVPEPPSAVVDLRCGPAERSPLPAAAAAPAYSSTSQGTSQTAAASTTTTQGHAVHAGPAAVSGQMASKVAASSSYGGHMACQAGSGSDSDDSSEEDCSSSGLGSMPVLVLACQLPHKPCQREGPCQRKGQHMGTSI
jgi:hypothetical protein